MSPAPRFIQGVFSFEGKGFDVPVSLGAAAKYAVPADKRAQLIYVRIGNSAAELVTLVLLRDGKLMRYFPIGAKAAEHVSLAVVEDLFPETKLELSVMAPKGAAGSVVLDLGLYEID